MSYLRVSNREFEKLLEVLVAFLFLIPLFSPLSNEFTVEDENMEESVEEQDDIVLDRNTVEQDGLRGSVEGVRHEGRLNHDEGVINIFFVDDVANERRSVNPGQKNNKALTDRRRSHQANC